jgi:ubiquinone biosynthesis accessory factor UbiK
VSQILRPFCGAARRSVQIWSAPLMQLVCHANVFAALRDFEKLCREGSAEWPMAAARAGAGLASLLEWSPSPAKRGKGGNSQGAVSLKSRRLKGASKCVDSNSSRTKIDHSIMRGTDLTMNALNLCKKGATMKQPNDVFNDLQQKMSEFLQNSPAKDVEKNMKAMLAQGFSKLDLVTREEFDTQTQVLVRTRARLEELEKRVAQLEQKLGTPGSGSQSQD